MLFLLLQVLVSTVLIAYAAIFLVAQSRRRKRSWNSIAGRLQAHDWGLEEIADGYLYRAGILATTEDIWKKIAGCRGLWAMYRNAAVLVELADYAAEHGNGIDPLLLTNLRRDAFQIRMWVIMALAQHAVSASSVGASSNAHRAAAAYSGLLASITQFMRENSANLFPRYLDAVS